MHDGLQGPSMPRLLPATLATHPKPTGSQSLEFAGFSGMIPGPWHLIASPPKLFPAHSLLPTFVKTLTWYGPFLPSRRESVTKGPRAVRLFATPARTHSHTAYASAPLLSIMCKWRAVGFIQGT